MAAATDPVGRRALRKKYCELSDPASHAAASRVSAELVGFAYATVGYSSVTAVASVAAATDPASRRALRKKYCEVSAHWRQLVP